MRKWSLGSFVAIGTLVVLRLGWPPLFASGGGLLIGSAVAFSAGAAVAAAANPTGAWRNPAIVAASVLTLLVAYILVVQSIPISPGAARGGANLAPPGTAAHSDAQRPGAARGRSSGGGPLSPSVVGTWEGHVEEGAASEAAPASTVPIIVDLLVFWRGSPGFDRADISTTVGESSSVHRVQSRGQLLELRFDRRTDTVYVRDHVARLGGANVVLLDNADDPRGLLVRGMVHVEPVIAGGAPSIEPGAHQAPWAQVIRRSPALFEYLRCDPGFADSNDPHTPLKLRACAQLRP